MILNLYFVRVKKDLSEANLRKTIYQLWSVAQESN